MASRTDRLTADLDRGFNALEAGDFDAAAACVERCMRIDRKHPGVITLTAALADATGDAETALAQYKALIEATPDDPMPRICAARIELRDMLDPSAALELLDEAFEYIDDELDLIEGVLVRTEALITLDELAEARESLAELSTSMIEDPAQAFDLAELAVGCEDPSLAARWIEVARKDPALEADSLHLLGRVHEQRGERKEMIELWQQVRELDAKAEPPPVTMADDEFERVARATFDGLPAELHEKLVKVPILIDDAPSQDQVADGMDPRLLGVFEGSPMADDLAPVITNIHLFKRNLERNSRDLDDLGDEISITVLHEIAHYFGMEEADLAKIGLD